MKRILYTFTAMMMVVIVSTINVFAMPYNQGEYTSVDMSSELLPSGVKRSKGTESTRTRGDFFMRADLIIQDNGKGEIGVLAIGYTNVPVEEAYITVYLDRWDESAERWRQYKYYEAEFLAADYPDGVTEPTVSISFMNNPRGYYYRLRGIFGVLNNGEFEGFSPITDGILIE